MSNKHYSTNCANVKKVYQKRKPLARAIALALMAGCVAVPTTGWAAIPITGWKFIDSNNDGEYNYKVDNTKEDLVIERGYIALKRIIPAGSPFSVRVEGGKYKFASVAPGIYQIWQVVDPLWLTNLITEADVKWSTDDPLSIEVTESEVFMLDQNGQRVSPAVAEINFPIPDLSKSSTDIEDAKLSAERECSTPDYVFCGIGASADCLSTQRPAGVTVLNLSDGNWPVNSPYASIETVFANSVVATYGALNIPYSYSVVTVGSICNYGTLQKTSPLPLRINFKDWFVNFKDARIENPVGSQQLIEISGVVQGGIVGGSLYNEGVIHAGDGQRINAGNKWVPDENWNYSFQGYPQLSDLMRLNQLVARDYNNVVYQSWNMPQGTAHSYFEWGTMINGSFQPVENSLLPPLPLKTGGDVVINVSDVFQNGTIEAGTGQSMSFKNRDETNSQFSHLRFGGKGGDTVITGSNQVLVTQNSTTTAGKGGDVKLEEGCDTCVWVELKGGQGGKLVVNTSSSGELVNIDGLLEGDSVYVDPSLLIGGKNLRVVAEQDVFIYGGDNWQLKLNNLSPDAIIAGRNIVLAVGPGGKIDLTGNTSNIFKAAGKIKIYADNVVLDPGVTLENLVSEVDGKKPEIVKAGNKIIYHATFSGTSQLINKSGVTVPVNLTLHNAGPKEDAYTLSATSQKGWTVSDLPATVTVEGLSQTDLNFNVTLPAEGNDVITVTATSQADSTVVATTQVQAAVEKPVVIEPEKVALTLTKAGEGTLTAQGINCGTDCTEDYAINTEIKLTATPANGYQFANWSGDCASDTVTMDQAKTCGANFTMLRYTASGKVLAETNMPLAGATVRIDNQTTTTDNLGYWKIDGLPNGTYTATATKNGHEIPSQKVVIGGEDLTFDFGVVYVAQGVIKNAQKQGVAGVTVIIGDKQTQTDATGFWKIEGLPAGESTLTATKDGYKFAPEKFVLGAQEPLKQLLLTSASTLVLSSKPSPWQPIRQGENVTYVYSLFNGGEQVATGVTLTQAVPEGAKVISLYPKGAGECSMDTLTCQLPDMNAGTTSEVEVVLQAINGASFKNSATSSSNEYPADVRNHYKVVKPHLSVTVEDSHDPVQMLTDLSYTASLELSPLAPEETAEQVDLTMELSRGLELKTITVADGGNCDDSEFPIIHCRWPNLSISSPNTVSQTQVKVDVNLKDAGLLVLNNEAKVSASNYPAHTVREKTNIFIPDTLKVKVVMVVDTTKSMQEGIDSVKKALEKLINTLPAEQRPSMALIEFKDDVRLKAFTQDTELMKGAVAKLLVEGGGTCPEASAEAIGLGLKHVEEGGILVLVTDASPYPEADIDALLKGIQTTNVVFHALISGDCTGTDDLNEKLTP